MRLEPRPQPVSYRWSKGFSYSPYSHEVPLSLPYDLIRLYQEKDVLSKGLADCVTYLKALRDKQAKCARQLNVQPPLPQKKRKRLQQTRRHLDSEIKNRQLAERACLNNLQACETNIYLANMKAYQLSSASFQAVGSISTQTSYTPTLCSNSGSEATDLTWEGWTDEVVTSPFMKKSSNSFCVDEVAPTTSLGDYNHHSAISRHVKRPPPLCPDGVELSDSLPVPPNTAQSQYKHLSFMSPTALIFRPEASSVVNRDYCPRSNTLELSMPSSSAAIAVGIVPKRRFSTAGVVATLDHLNIFTQSSQHHLFDQNTRGLTTPQLQACPQTNVRPPMNRQRTNSL